MAGRNEQAIIYYNKMSLLSFNESSTSAQIKILHALDLNSKH